MYIAFAYFSMIALGIIDNSRGPLYLDLIQSFQITKAQGSFVFSLASLCSFLITIPADWWTHKWGAARSLKLALIFDFIFCLGVYFCPDGIQGYYIMLGLSCIFGMAVGIKSISLNLLISNFSEGMSQTRVFSGLHSMYGVSSLVAPMLATLLLGFTGNWRLVFACLGVIPFVAFVSFIKLRRDHVQPLRSAASKDIPPSLIFSLGMLLCCYVCSEILVSSRLVLFLKESRHFTSAQASQYLTFFFCGLLGGRLFFSLRDLNFAHLTLLRFSVLLSLIFSFLGLNFHPLFLSLTGLSMSYFFPCAMSLINTQFREVANLLIARVMQMVGLALVLIHIAFGQIATYLSLEMAMYLIIFLSVIVLSILLLDRRLRT